MRRTIAVTAVVGLMGLTAANASADKGGVPHEGSNGKGRQEQGAPPAANDQTAPAPARRTPPPRKQEKPKKKTTTHLKQHRHAAKPAPAAAAPAEQHGQPKVTICHRTGSESHPWVQITVEQPAVKAHSRHGDLVPAPAGGCPAPAAPEKAAAKGPAPADAHEGREPEERQEAAPAAPASSPAATTVAADAVTPAPTVTAESKAQPSLPDGGLGPVTIVRRADRMGAVLAETASSPAATPRGRVLAETASAPTAVAAAVPARGSGLPFTGWPAWLVVIIGAAALLAGVALRRAHAAHR